MRTPEQICEEAAYRARLIELEALNAELVAALEDMILNMGGHHHWDKQGTSGVNCPICINQRDARERARAALAKIERLTTLNAELVVALERISYSAYSNADFTSRTIARAALAKVKEGK